MSLVSIYNGFLSYNTLNLLQNAELNIEKNEKICLIGKNGEGKSTLLDVINKNCILDKGHICYKKNLKISKLSQNPPTNLKMSVYDFVIEEINPDIQHLNHYEQIINNKPNNKKNLKKINILQNIIEDKNLWKLKIKIDKMINQFNLEKDVLLSSLSRGSLQKTMLCKTFIQNADLFLLDEPTNHLDIFTIYWLEKFLKNIGSSILFVSHDRSFIERISTRMIYLNNGKLTSLSNNYDNYLQFESELKRIQILNNKNFLKKLNKEEIWIKKGIQARTTRNEGRVKKLKIMREKKSCYTIKKKLSNIKINETIYSLGKIVFKLNKISYLLNQKVIISNFSDVVHKSERIALIGNNGSGKTTLIKLIIGELLVNSGNIMRSEKLKIAYFDQSKLTLNIENNILFNIMHGQTTTQINGKPKNIIKYLETFSFDSDKLNVPVKSLSGGEKSRLLLAKLFLQPSNVLILDEPTNDLDLETLNLLEKLIKKYKGTVLLVSHDRKFIENTVNRYWMFKDNGVIEKYIGNNSFFNTYDIFINTKSKYKNKKLKKNKIDYIHQNSNKIIKLNYKNKQELESLPTILEELENNIKYLQTQINNSKFSNYSIIEKSKLLKDLSHKEKELEKKFIRWEFLEKLKIKK